jgi:hypothetical protein
LKSDARSECRFTLLDTTASFFNCAVPTLFAGSTPAAKAVPPSATTSAIPARTVPGAGSRRRPRAGDPSPICDLLFDDMPRE